MLSLAGAGRGLLSIVPDGTLEKKTFFGCFAETFMWVEEV